MKRLLILFGVLDIITLIRSYKHIILSTFTSTYFPLITVGHILIYASLVLSALFLLKQNKLGLWLTYGQFPLRIAFAILSFGFLLELNQLFDKRSKAYLIIFWILIGLEVLRLIFTILIHRKYFSKMKNKLIYR